MHGFMTCGHVLDVRSSCRGWCLGSVPGRHCFIAATWSKNFCGELQTFAYQTRASISMVHARAINHARHTARENEPIVHVVVASISSLLG